MEKVGILFAAACFLIFPADSRGQEPAADSLKSDEKVMPDSSETISDTTSTDRSADDNERKLDPLQKSRTRPDTSGIWAPEPEPEAEDTSRVEKSVYEERPYLARGVGDEFKPYPDVVLVTHGTVGTPVIPTEYLNVAGIEVRLNGLPFPYNGLYRPYIIGTDLNVIPWEILNDIRLENGRADLSLGLKGNDRARSDVEVYRGAYGYSGTRWRFFQPIGTKTKGYFTLGFKKTDSFYSNSDYNGFHVAGGVERKFLGGVLSVDLWKHRAKAGLLSFDFMVNQLSRQSRGIDRTEITFSRKVVPRLTFELTGLYHRSAQTVRGYTDEFKTKNDIGGGKGELRYQADSLTIAYSSAYYNSRLYGHPGVEPSVNIYEHTAAINGRLDRIDYLLNLSYEWAGPDRGAFLPAADLRYEIAERLSAGVSFFRERRAPDLYLWYFDDNVAGLGSGLLNSYHFMPSPYLKSPLTSAASASFGWGISVLDFKAGFTYKEISDQIKLAYYQPQPGEYIVSPVNFDDRLMILDFGTGLAAGPLKIELSAAYRVWRERYFDDGLEKGPALAGFGSMSFEKEFFIPDLYLGGSLEVQASSRRDFRTMQIGLTDGYLALQGRIVFRYKDFTFHLSEDNLLATEYYPLYPFPGTPRSVWWGFRWNFLN